MNQKTAKHLRQIAMGMVVAAQQQKPDTIKKVAYRQDRKGTITVAPNTLKGVYKGLKAAVRKGTLPRNVGAIPTPTAPAL
jgi:hypothetical protein